VREDEGDEERNTLAGKGKVNKAKRERKEGEFK
jgi:hypothetical protein